jgi:hypothetical protein
MRPGCFLLLLCLLTAVRSAAAASTAKDIMVYYMPWFGAKPSHDSWGWHWTMDHFKPDTIKVTGEREIASWYYPLIGPYDSSDTAVLEYHVLLMKLAGIDGVIVDWYGASDYLDYGANHRATLKLFETTRRAGLKFAICYEDQTIRHLIDGGQLPAHQAIAHACQEMLCLQTNFFRDASYLRLNGRPVLLNFGPQYFTTSTNWELIFSALEPSNRPAFFNEDNPLAVSAGAFDWPPMWMSQNPGTGGVLSGAALDTYLADFEKKAAGWPAYISSAFPRFHDIYQRAGARNYWGYLGDRHGETFRDTLRRAMTNASAIVQIVTWNDFGEGTMIEPTKEYGWRDLGIIQAMRRQYLDPPFSYSTNDLPCALQFYYLRKQAATNDVESARLDEIFQELVSGKIEAARAAMNRLSNAGPGKMQN